MTDNKNICEEIQIAILSDDELSDIQKEHIENCEECRALLSQVEKMKNDLCCMSVPGIEEGQITKAVMEKIKSEKTAVPFPKFKITHHLGTAAAIAIILVAALMIKNPSEMDKNAADENFGSPVSFDEAQNNHILGGVKQDSTPDGEILYRTFTDETVADVTEEAAEEEVLYDYSEETAVNGTLQAKTASPAYDTNDAILLEDSDAGDDVPDTEAEENAPMLFSVSTENGEQSVSDLHDDFDGNTSAVDVGSSGGGGGSGAVLKAARPASGGGSAQNEEKTTEEPAQAESQWAEEVIDSLENSETQSFVFEGIEFEKGEDMLDYNIALANERLSELYGGEYVISKEKLILLGLDNEMFIKLANSITKEMFLFYKQAFDIFE